MQYESSGYAGPSQAKPPRARASALAPSSLTPEEAAVAAKLVDPEFAEALRRVEAPSDAFPWYQTPMRGPLGVCVEWIEACNTRSLPLAALGAALVGFGGACARRIYVRWSAAPGARPMPIHQPVVTIARTGAGKDAPLRAARAMVQAAGYRTLSALPFHHTSLYAELVLSGGAIGLMLDEVDGTFASLVAHNEHAAQKDATIKTMLSSGEHLPAPPVARSNAQRKIVEERRGPSAWDDGVKNPALVMFGVSTRQVLDRLASNVAGGLAGRMLVIDADGPLSEPRQPTANTAEIPGPVRAWIDRVRPTSLEDSFSAADFDAPTILVPSQDALDAATWAGDDLTAESNAAHEAGDHHAADLLARGLEATLRVASTLAVANSDAPLEATIEPKHVQAALAIVRWCITRLAGETGQREDLSGPGKAVRIIRERLTKDCIRRGAPSPWHYRVHVQRGIEIHAEQAIRALEAAGEVSIDGKRLALTARI